MDGGLHFTGALRDCRKCGWGTTLHGSTAGLPEVWMGGLHFTGALRNCRKRAQRQTPALNTETEVGNLTGCGWGRLHFMGGLRDCQKRAERQMPALNTETEIDGLQGAGSEHGGEASHRWEPHSFCRSGSSFFSAASFIHGFTFCV